MNVVAGGLSVTVGHRSVRSWMHCPRLIHCYRISSRPCGSSLTPHHALYSQHVRVVDDQQQTGYVAIKNLPVGYANTVASFNFIMRASRSEQVRRPSVMSGRNLRWSHRMLCCPLVSHGEYADVQDRTTDRRMPVRYITLSGRGVQNARTQTDEENGHGHP